MILPAFQLHRPVTVDEALRIAASCEGDFDYIAGGTDLLPNYKNRLNPRRHVIALWMVGDLAASGARSLGAMARLADLEAEPGLRRRYPGLAEAAAQVASPLVRQQATLGGNLLVETRCYYFNQSLDWRASKGYCMKADGDVCLVVPQKETCYAIYAGDSAAVLRALGATCPGAGCDGGREIASGEFFAPDGIRKNVLKRGDLITRITLPEGAERRRSGYAKLRLRDSFDFPDAGVGAALLMDGDVVEDLQIAVSAVSMTPLMFPEATARAHGEKLTDDLIRSIADDIAARCKPVKNVMFPPQYRKQMVGLYTRRLLTRLARPA